jgi:hypothetical protein
MSTAKKVVLVGIPLPGHGMRALPLVYGGSHAPERRSRSRRKLGASSAKVKLVFARRDLFDRCDIRGRLRQRL